MDSWLPCKDPSRLKGKEKGLDYLPAFAKASNNQIWPCIVEKVHAVYVRLFSLRVFGSCVLLVFWCRKLSMWFSLYPPPPPETCWCFDGRRSDYNPF